ncbi:MAG TPA: hypothetical protein VNZ57_15750 [Longimicrobiales bacterium]|nr:hypothetical protein [Longimicrobiales bacterium]
MADTGYSRSPRLLKGALVEFSERFLGPIPNVIVFQYNPESLTRSLTVWQPPEESAEGAGAGGATERPTAQPSDPPETFTLELILDATDDLERGDFEAVATGVADRIAALELLLYPTEQSLAGQLLGSISASLGGGGISASLGGGADATAGRGTVPIVLFIWGPGRIVPVRLTTFSVEEQAFSPILYPIRAKVSVGLKVMTPADLESYPDGLSKEIAIKCFEFTRLQKKVLGAANLANSVESILGMLPF